MLHAVMPFGFQVHGMFEELVGSLDAEDGTAFHTDYSMDQTNADKMKRLQANIYSCP